MVGIIICTAIISCFTTAIVIVGIYTSTKSSKMRDEMFHRYYVMEDLWLKTGSINILTIAYSNKVVNIKVKLSSLAGTNNNCRVYSAFINDIECATAVKLMDKYNTYYTFYVDEEFDDKEVWDILDTAYKRAQEKRIEEEQKKKISKKSILKETTNESVRTF